MRMLLFVCLSVILMYSEMEIFAQLTPSKMSSTTQPSSTIKGREHLEKPETKSTAPIKSAPPPLIPVPPQVPQHADYLHPGILVFLNGRWEGSDHLLNLPNNIGVYVTILKPEEEKLDITQEQLQKEVEAIFAQANIRPLTLASQGRPPLPAFEIEVFLYPIDKGYAACCDGRLFEAVTLDRFKMDPNMSYQAITWEKQTLIVGPKASFGDQLSKTIQSIAATFVERFQSYEAYKNRTYR